MCNSIDLLAVNDNAFKTFKNEWSSKINRIQARSGRGSNKLRTYIMFKSDGVQPYVLSVRARVHISALARLRAGVIHIIIKIGRYTNNPVNNRECPFCPGTVEDDEHVVLMSYPKYNTVIDAREDLFYHAVYCHPVFLI